MFGSSWGRRVSGFAVSSAAVALLCFSLIAVLCCAVLPNAQLAYADTPEFPESQQPHPYQLWWNESEDGSISVADGGGQSLSFGAMVIEGTEVTVTFSPKEGKYLNLAFVYSNNPYSEEDRVLSTLEGNTLTFVMPDKNVSIYYAFANEFNPVYYGYDAHGSAKVADQSGTSVIEAKRGDVLTATFTPASGYYLKSAWLSYDDPMLGWVESNLPVVDGKSVFEMPASELNVHTQFARLDGKYEVITYAYALGGSVVPQDEKGRTSYFFTPGETVYLKCTSNDGYELDQVYVHSDEIGDIEFELQSDGRYAFEMPESDVGANASFESVSDGIKAWIYEYVVGSQGTDAPYAQGDLLGEVWLEDAEGRAVSGVMAGESAKICVKPDEDHFVYAVKCRYNPLDGEDPSNGEIALVRESGDKYSFVMPDCADICIEVYYQRVGDGKFDVTYWSQEVKPENMSVKIMDEYGREISSAAPGDKVIFEYLPGSDFVLNYVYNYVFDEEGSGEKLSPVKYSFVMPEGPLGIEVSLSRVDVEIQTDDTAYVPDSGRDTAREVALGVFWDLVLGKTPQGMTDEEAQSLREMLNDPRSSGAYLDVILRANETTITESQEGLILDIIRNDEFIVFSFDLSVIFSMSTDGGWGPEVNLTELSDGVHFQLMPENVENKFVRIVRIHEGVAEEVPLLDVNGEGVIIEADRFSVYSAIASDTTTVAFESSGGNAVASQEVGYGQKLAKPIDPTREGYVFEGWYADEALTVAYDFEAPVVQHLGTLYAKWSVEGSGTEMGTEDGNAGSVRSDEEAIAKTGDGAMGFAAAAGAVALLAALVCVVAFVRRRSF